MLRKVMQYLLTVTILAGIMLTSFTVKVNAEEPTVTISSFYQIPMVWKGNTVGSVITVTPEDSSITASSSDTAVAEAYVSISGTKRIIYLKGLSLGTATITVTASKDGYIPATRQFTVTVSAAPTVSINDIGVKNPGDSVTISGTAPLDAGTFYMSIQKPDHSPLTSFSGIIGSFTKTFTLPADAPTGNYQVIISGMGGFAASKEFIVEDKTSLPKVTISSFYQIPTVWKGNSVGSSIIVSPEDASITAASSNTAIVEANVIISGTKKIVYFKGLSDGTATITITASKDGYIPATRQFTVTVSPAPVVSVNDIGVKNPGDSVTISGTAPLDAGTFYMSILKPDHSPLTSFSGIIGSFTKTFTLPTDAPAGNYQVIISGTGGLAASKEFVVEDKTSLPKVTISSFYEIPMVWKGNSIGSVITVTPEDASITVSSSDQTIVEPNVSISGTKRVVYLKGLREGTAAITVTASKDGYIPATRQFNLTVNPAPAVSIDEIGVKNPGDSVTISGTTPLDAGTFNILVAKPGYRVLASFSGIAGSFTKTFTLPSDAPTGDYRVVINGAGGFAASKEFKVELPPVLIEDVNDITVQRNSSAQITIATTPSDAIITAHATANEGAVELSVSGNIITVTGLSKGTANVLVTASRSGYAQTSKQFAVTITPSLLDRILNELDELSSGGIASNEKDRISQLLFKISNEITGRNDKSTADNVAAVRNCLKGVLTAIGNMNDKKAKESMFADVVNVISSTSSAAKSVTDEESAAMVVKELSIMITDLAEVIEFKNANDTKLVSENMSIILSSATSLIENVSSAEETEELAQKIADSITAVIDKTKGAKADIKELTAQLSIFSKKFSVKF